MNHGKVIWITGLSGAGKSTLGGIVQRQLLAANRPCVFLDGDAFRQVVADTLGHSSQDRLTNAYRLCRMCALLSSQGVHVVCATMSLFPEIWNWNRENLRSYFEVYLKTDSATRLGRDARAVYEKSQDVVGKDLPFHEPNEAHLIVDNKDASLPELEFRAGHIIEAAFGR